MGEKKWNKTLISSFLVVCFVFCMGLAIDGMITSAHARDYLVVQTWGGQIDLAGRKAFYEPFTEMTGIEIKTVEAGTSIGGKLAAFARSGNIEWDVVTADYEGYFTKWYNKGLLEEIDYNIVNNTQDLMEGSAKPFGVAFYLEGICMVFNNKVFPEGKPQPSSYKDFFDVKKFPGPRMMHNWGGPSDNLGIALMSEGVSRDEMYPLDWDRAFKIMDKINPHIKVWYTTGAQQVQALLDEEAVIAICTDGRAKQAINSGAPVEMVWNNAFYYLCYQGVVKNSPMKDAAMKLVKFCNRPEQQAIFNNYIGYTPSNVKAIRYIHPKFQKMQYTHPDNIDRVFNINLVKNAQWTIDNVDEVDERWNSWIAQ